MPVLRVMRALVLLAAISRADRAAAQSRVLLQGTLDIEGWATDTNSNLLSRNAGAPLGAGRIQLWGALQPWTRVVLYGLVEGEASTAHEESATADVELAAVRVLAGPRLQVDAGIITSPVGTFANRRFSWRNPLIGEPDGYAVQYPLGVLVSGAVGMLDYRAGMFSLPTVHDEYTPPPTPTARPVLALGLTPTIGLRVGASFTKGPYLNDDLTATQLAGTSWNDHHQWVAAGELQWSIGYFELVAEMARSSYEVPSRDEPVLGFTWYAEGKYTVTPRLFMATRLERNDYPFIRPLGDGSWVARRTDFHDEEIGVGYRLAAATLLKVSWRRDDWRVDDQNRAFVRPGGHAFAMQLSQRFDVLEWLR